MTMPFDPREGLIIAPVRLFGPAQEVILRLAIDTGATLTLVSRAMLSLVGYDASRIVRQTKALGLSGAEMISTIIVDQIEAIDITQHNFVVGAHDLPTDSDVDGVLGLDFFRGNRLLIDLRIGLVTVD